MAPSRSALMADWAKSLLRRWVPTSLTSWFRDAASAVAQAPQMPKDALLLVDGVTWLTASRGAAAAVDTWPRAALIGWDPRTTPPAGFVVLADKPADAGDLRALVAGALASPPAADASGASVNGAG